MVRENVQQTIDKLLNENPLDDSFVLGYYGGGNYGDELLFEVLQHIFFTRGYTQISFLYQKPATYQRFHKDLGYQAVDSSRKGRVLRTVMKRKNLVIGGGGLWGLDVNLNVVLMSLMLFVARWFMGKNIYLIGVGYYGSTTRMGHIAAWLAGKSAHRILARDGESYENFARLNPQTYLTDDIAFMLPNIREDVLQELTAFEAAIGDMSNPTVMISLRRFKSDQPNPYTEAVETWLMAHPEAHVILALMEPREVDPKGFARLKQWQRKLGNATVIDFDYNPVVLYRFFERHRDVLSYIGPQFHVQLVAHLGGVRLLPLVYDNKVAQLLDSLQYKNPIAISEVSAKNIETFVSQKRRP